MCLKLNLNSILIYNKEEVNKSNLIKPSLKDIASSVLLDDKSSDIDTLSNFNPKKTGDSYFLPVKTSFGGFFNREQLKTNEVVKKEIKQEAIAIPKVIEISSTNKYNLTEKRVLKDGVEALQYEGTGNKKATLRAYIIDPKKANISVNYKQGGENIHNFLKDKNISVVTNGTFMNNYLPQGNIIGENLKNKAQGIYQLEGNDSAANGRAFFAIKKDGTLEIKKGGKIDSNTIQAYSSLISGLPILSDKDHNSFKDKDAFLENLKVNNDSSALRNIFRIKKEEGDPKKMNLEKLDLAKPPRSALGITKDNKLIIINLGQGKERSDGGTNVYAAYKVLKILGAVSSVLLDGGGAPFLIEKGKLLTQPDINGGYDRNASFIVIK